jgi:hypothetical protein
VTAWIVHRFAELVGLPGSIVCETAYAFRSPLLLEAGIALKLPSWRLHVFALDLAK